MDDRELALKGIDLWLNLEISKLSSDEPSRVESFLRKRFNVEKLNPLLEVLGLLEISLIEERVSPLSEEEREGAITEVVDELAKRFPQVVSLMEEMLERLQRRIGEFKAYAEEYSRR